VNLTQVKRVLRQYQMSAGLGETGCGASSWEWTVKRTYAPSGDGTEKKEPGRFAFAQRADEAIRMQEIHDGKSTGRIIEFDDERAVQRARSGAEAYDLSPEVAMVYSVQYVMQHNMLAALESIDLSEIRHAGGGSVIRRSEDAAETVSRMVEVLEWPVGEHAVATFEFDVENHRLLRIAVRDTPSGSKATIELGDHERMSGIVWPRSMEVRGSGLAYRDAILELELTP